MALNKTAMILENKIENGNLVVTVMNVTDKDRKAQTRKTVYAMVMIHDYLQDTVNQFLNLDLPLEHSLPRLRAKVGLQHHEQMTKEEAEKDIGHSLDLPYKGG